MIENIVFVFFDNALIVLRPAVEIGAHEDGRHNSAADQHFDGVDDDRVDDRRAAGGRSRADALGQAVELDAGVARAAAVVDDDVADLEEPLAVGRAGGHRAGVLEVGERDGARADLGGAFGELDRHGVAAGDRVYDEDVVLFDPVLVNTRRDNRYRTCIGLAVVEGRTEYNIYIVSGKVAYK